MFNNDFLRRAGKLLGRSERSVPKIVFIHIPKSGGTSLDSGIRSAMGSDNEPRVDPVAAWKAGRFMHGNTDLVAYFSTFNTSLQYLLCYHLHLNWDYISGHFPICSEILESYSNYKFITIVRNPVDRWRSNYLYNKVTSPDVQIPPYWSYSGSIEEEFNEVKNSGMGLQMGAAAISMLTGIQPRTLLEAEEASEIAVSNLKRFSAVGSLETFEKFVTRLSNLVGNTVKPKRSNVTDSLVDPAQIETISKVRSFLESSDVSQRITEWCAPELKVYEFAKRFYE